MAKRFTVEAVFKAVNKFTAPVSRMQNSLQKFTRRTTANLKKIDRGLAGITRGFKKVAVGATIAGAITGAAMAEVIRTGAQFEQTIVNAGARFKGMTQNGKLNEKQLKLVAEAAREVGRTTEFMASDAAGALNSMAKAGFRAGDAIAMLPNIANLATVAETDMATATDVATKALGAFGLRSDDPIQQALNMARTIDVLSLSANRGNTTITDMFLAIRDAAPIAIRAGSDIEATTALFAKLADAGIEATKAGTAVKRIALAVAAPGSTEGTILRRLGVETFDKQKGKARDLIAVVKDLGIALKKLPPEKQLPIAEVIFGKIGLAGALNFLEQADAVGELRDELKGAGGNAQKMAGIMRNTTAGAMKELNSAVESVKISIFELSKGAFGDLVKQGTEWVRLNEKWIALKVGAVFKAIFANPQKVIKWGKALLIVGTVFTALVITVKSAIAVMTLFNLVVAMNPIGLVVIAIGALIAILAAAVIWFDEWTAWLRESSTGFKILLVAVSALVGGPIAALIAVVAIVLAHWEPLQKFFEDLFFDMFVGFDKFMKKISTLKGIKDLLKDAFFGMFDPILHPIRTALNAFDELKLKVLEFRALTATGADLASIGLEINKIEGQIRGRSEEGEGPKLGASVVSPQQQLARSLEEKRTLEKTELTIKDETGRAQLGDNSRFKFGNIKLQQSGGF